MFCSNCGSQIRETDLFCPTCGAKNAEPVTPQPMTQPEPAAHSPQEQPDYNPQPAFDPQPNYNPQPAFDQQSAYDPQPAYDQQSAYDQQPAYDTEQPAPVEGQKRSVLKPVLIGLAGLVAVAAIVFGIVKLLGSRSKDNKLVAAAKASIEELSDYLETMPNMKQMIQTMDRVSDGQKSEGSLAVQIGGSESVDVSANFRMDMKERMGLINLALNVDEIGTPIHADLYMDENMLLLASQELLGEDEGITLPLKDLGQKWNSSALSRLADSKLPADLSVNLFAQGDYADALENTFGEQWTKFEATVEVKPYEGTSYFSDGSIYTVSWDSSLLRPMYEEANRNLEDVDKLDPNDLLNGSVSGLYGHILKGDYSNLTAYMVVGALGEFDESGAQGQFRLNDKDQLTGIYVKTEDEYFAVQLEGERNPWQKVTFTSGYSYTYSGNQYESRSIEELDLDVTDAQLTVTVKDIYQDGEDTWENVEARVVYDDITGRISVYDRDDRNTMGSASLSLKPDGDRVMLEVREDSYTNLHLSVVVGPFSGKIEAPATKLRDLLELDENALQSLVMQVMMRIQKLMPADQSFFH